VDRDDQLFCSRLTESEELVKSCLPLLAFFSQCSLGKPPQSCGIGHSHFPVFSPQGMLMFPLFAAVHPTKWSSVLVRVGLLVNKPKVDGERLGISGRRRFLTAGGDSPSRLTRPLHELPNLSAATSSRTTQSHPRTAFREQL